MNPQILLALFQEIDTTYQRWSSASLESTRESAYQQRLGRERNREMEGLANSCLAKAEEAEQKSYHALNEAENAVSTAQATREISLQTLSKAREALQSSQSCLGNWQARLGLSEAFASECRNELNRAIDWLNSCIAELNQAQGALQAARSDLSYCLSYRDKDGRGRDCSSHQNRVDYLEGEVAHCQSRVGQAEADVSAAQERLNLAIQDVQACRNAVRMAEVALRESQNSIYEAQAALNSADESVALAQNSVEEARRALSYSKKLQELSQNMKVLVYKSNDHLSMSENHVTTAEFLSSEAAHTVSRLRHDLADATQSLIDFNSDSGL
jgi:chromosome segregation ATPase